MVDIDMGLSILFSSERRMSVVMALVFLPWMAGVLFTAWGWAALTSSGLRGVYEIKVGATGCERPKSLQIGRRGCNNAGP
jgi:hypothetical protein